MDACRHVQIHQYNDPEILEFFNQHRVQYRLVGDHLFIVRARGRDTAAGPGDWLTIAADGQLEVERGEYLRRAQQALLRARRARRESLRLRAEGAPDPDSRDREARAGSSEQLLAELPESETERWKRGVEAEARHRLKSSIRHVAQKG